jgi:O-antigen/teichoic acid export membrane protein
VEDLIARTGGYISRRIAHWTPLLARFFWLQALSQLLAVAAGLLVVRWLDVGQFAIYTVALAVQTTLVILADSGITNSLMARGGAAAGDRARFSAVVTTAIALRRRLQIVTLAVGVPVLVLLLRTYGVPMISAALASLAVALALHASITQGVYSTVLFLQLQPDEVQRAGVRSGVVRLLMTVTALSLADDWLLFLWIGAAALFLQGALLERAAKPHLGDTPARSAEEERAMVLAFRNQLLNGIYFALQPQILVWIMTAFGSVQQVAEAGALGRLAIAFSLISAAFSSLALPRFARAVDPRAVRQRYVGLTALMTAIGAAAVAFAWAFPQVVLFVLGAAYMHLDAEVVWIVGASAVSLVSITIHLLNTARGWVRGIWLGVPATFAMQIALVRYVDLGSIRGAILIQASAYIAPLLINLAIGLRGMREPTRPPAAAAVSQHGHAG